MVGIGERKSFGCLLKNVVKPLLKFKGMISLDFYKNLNTFDEKYKNTRKEKAIKLFIFRVGLGREGFRISECQSKNLSHQKGGNFFTNPKFKWDEKEKTNFFAPSRSSVVYKEIVWSFSFCLLSFVLHIQAEKMDMKF